MGQILSKLNSETIFGILSLRLVGGLVVHGKPPWTTRPLTIGWTKNELFGKCKVLMVKKSSYVIKTSHAKFQLNMWG